jgi:uncharacterized protein (UPF0371 family)
MATCLSQLYHENKRGVKAGYAKFETFPIWSLPLNHAVNVAYEAATADLNDKNMIDPFHLDAYGKVAVNYNRDIEIFPVLKKMFEEIYGTSPYQSPTDMGVNMAGFCIDNDEAVQEASRQEMIRRYFASRTRYYQEQCGAEEVQKQEMLLQQLNVDVNDRACIKAAREKEKERKVYCGAMELLDGSIVTAATGDSMGSCAALVVNAIKQLAGIDDSIHLIAPETFEPIKELKTSYLGSQNPRLHTNEMLIALALSAKTKPEAALALEQLPKLKGVQAHITCDVSAVDLQAYNTLGIQVTYETEKK